MTGTGLSPAWENALSRAGVLIWPQGIILIIPCGRFKRTTRKNWFSRAGLLSGPHGKIPIPLFSLTHFKFFTSSLFLFPLTQFKIFTSYLFLFTFILPPSLPSLSLLSLSASFLLPSPPSARGVTATADGAGSDVAAMADGRGGGRAQRRRDDARQRGDDGDNDGSGNGATTTRRRTAARSVGYAITATTMGFFPFFSCAGGIIWPHGIINYPTQLGHPHIKILIFTDPRVYTDATSTQKNGFWLYGKMNSVLVAARPSSATFKYRLNSWN